MVAVLTTVTVAYRQEYPGIKNTILVKCHELFELTEKMVLEIGLAPLLQSHEFLC